MRKAFLTLAFILASIFSQAQNEKEKVEIGIDIREQGVYSVSVCDADVVLPDTSQPNAVAQLLLCSEIRGKVENPNYYFDNPTRQKDAELDLLMMTQGWRRYEVKDIMNETFPQVKHSIETSQTISGHVERTLNKSPKNMRLLMLSPMVGGMQEFELQDSSRFVINGLDFVDGTPFTLQATTQKGRTNFIQIYVHPDDFPSVRPLTITHRLPVAEKFVEQSKNQHQVNDIRNMQYLDEVEVIGKKVMNPLGIEPFKSISEGDYFLDHAGASSVVAQRLGMLAVGVGDNIKIGRFAGLDNGEIIVKKPLVVIDNNVDSIEAFLQLPPENIKHVEFFKDDLELPAVFGHFGMFDVLLVYTKPGYRIGNHSLSMTNVRPLGYSQPVEFYSPQYPAEDKEVYTFPDFRTTLYWNPAFSVVKDGKAQIDFYNSDKAKRYLVTVEGVSDEGKIISETKIVER